MFENECLECYNLNHKLDDSQHQITSLELQIRELKTELSKNSNIVTNYMQYKKENESLKKEIALIKQSNLNPHLNNQLAYDMEIMKKKFLIERDKNLSLKTLNMQLSSIAESHKIGVSNYDGKELNKEVAKLKKELSEKDRKVNDLSSMLERLKKNSSLTPVVGQKSKNYNESLEKMAGDSVFEDSQKEYFTENIGTIGNSTNNANNGNIGNGDKYNLILNSERSMENINGSNGFTSNYQKCKEMKNILEENEFLNRKYRKYKVKYIKFKSKYSEMKAMLSMLYSSGFPGFKGTRSKKLSTSQSNSNSEDEATLEENNKKTYKSEAKQVETSNINSNSSNNDILVYNKSKKNNDGAENSNAFLGLKRKSERVEIAKATANTKLDVKFSNKNKLNKKEVNAIVGDTSNKVNSKIEVESDLFENDNESDNDFEEPITNKELNNNTTTKDKSEKDTINLEKSNSNTSLKISISDFNKQNSNNDQSPEETQEVSNKLLNFFTKQKLQEQTTTKLTKQLSKEKSDKN